ncbi:MULTISPECIES: efflux RND transporter periplasmic adaptor subunit [unclassified Massilia]|uniref:efflux RND transporter periplasmic adaptor subunit n=1 Tax=unclassified Massilia TaxID=2609279 RepID=UPI00177CDBD1|nr:MULTISPECIES: efflux RND transporter periplasmic adaptor subunit [unclassified Massilia]MBD8529843.1 efflux RND transporter periplasmic adaptor subunit [Massilia sp. CFBP 13647]MBD8672145.1 efflux RND transporter periplasmic adaptor subunit [Massilia sp. CFBP 13721]
MPSTTSRSLLIGSAALFSLLLAACGKDDAKKAAAPATPALTVSTAAPTTASLPLQLGANGNVAAWQEAVIGSESGGLRLLEVRVNVGDVVKKGEVLAVFSADTVNADVEQARAALQEAQANAAEAAANARRGQSLKSSGAMSEQQVNQYLTAERTAAARVAAAKATLTQQQLRLKYTQVVAPDSGVISARSATVGAVVGVGTELFRLIRQGRLEWRAELPALEVGRIKPGTRVRVKGASGSEVIGKVRMIAPTVDAQTRTTLVYVDLPPGLSANAPLKAGMFAGGEFELGASNALTVPQQAIAVRDGFSYVFRLNKDSRVSQLKIGTGRRLGDRIEVVSGLAPDAQIVVNGAGFLNDGDLVKNVPAPAAPAKVAKR